MRTRGARQRRRACETGYTSLAQFSVSAKRLLMQQFQGEGLIQEWMNDTHRISDRLLPTGWIHELACPSENNLYAAELLNWRMQRLTLEPTQ